MKISFLGKVMLLVLQVFAADGSASDPKSLFEEGNRLFLDSRFEEAAEHFRAAYSARPSYKILYNLGQSETAAKRYGVALEAFEKYLADGGDEINIERQEEVRVEIKRLREMTGFVEIKATDGVVVFIDGLKRGVYPTSQRIPVAGTVMHAFKAIEGNKEMSREVRVSGGDTVTVEVKFDTAADATVTAYETEDVAETQNDGIYNSTNESSSTRKLRLAGFVLTGIGVGALVGGSICGGLFLNTENMLENKCNDLACAEKDRDLIDKRDRLVVASAALWIAGGLMTAGGVGMILAAALKKRKWESKTVYIVPRLGGLAVTGRF